MDSITLCGSNLRLQEPMVTRVWLTRRSLVALHHGDLLVTLVCSRAVWPVLPEVGVTAYFPGPRAFPLVPGGQPLLYPVCVLRGVLTVTSGSSVFLRLGLTRLGNDPFPVWQTQVAEPSLSHPRGYPLTSPFRCLSATRSESALIPLCGRLLTFRCPVTSDRCNSCHGSYRSHHALSVPFGFRLPYSTSPRVPYHRICLAAWLRRVHNAALKG